MGAVCESFRRHPGLLHNGRINARCVSVKDDEDWASSGPKIKREVPGMGNQNRCCLYSLKKSMSPRTASTLNL